MNEPSLRIEERTLWRRILRRLESPPKRSNKPTRSPSARRIGVGLVGVGNVARWLYLPRLKTANSLFRLAGVYDVDRSAARKAAEPFGAAVCGSLSDLIANESVEAVLICTPVQFHCQAAISALAAKKHVLCEKPLGASLEESRLMREAAQTAGTVNMVNFSYRFRPELAFVARLIRVGALGRIYHASGTFSQGQWFTEADLPAQERVDAASWKFGPAGGGVVLDLGPHMLDFCRCCFGEITQVQAWTKSFRQDPAPCEDACGVSLAFEGGSMAHVLTSRWATGYKERTWLEISGSQGSLVLEQGTLKLWTRDFRRWRSLLIPSSRNGDFLEQFHAAILGQAIDIPTFGDGLKNNEALEAIFQSAKSGCAVTLPASGSASSTRSIHPCAPECGGALASSPMRTEQP